MLHRAVCTGRYPHHYTGTPPTHTRQLPGTPVGGAHFILSHKKRNSLFWIVDLKTITEQTLCVRVCVEGGTQLHHPGPPLEIKTGSKIVVTVMLHLLWSACTSCHTVLEGRMSPCSDPRSPSLMKRQSGQTSLAYDFFSPISSQMSSLGPTRQQLTVEWYSRVSGACPDAYSIKSSLDWSRAC